MLYSINTSRHTQLNWGANGNERIVQNVLNLINTWQYEVAYNRIMGIKPEILDKPAHIASEAYIAEVYRVVSMYEPRAKVKEVKFIGLDEKGNMQHEVVIEI